jgi:uncharacterized protein (TIGR03118 family)
MLRMRHGLRQGLAGSSAHRKFRTKYRPSVELLEKRSLLAASFLQTNLISDISGMAAVTDPNLVNPWGIAFAPTGPFWINDNGAGVSTVYDGTGHPTPAGTPLVVTIPLPPGNTGASAPTGIVFNTTTDFVITANGKTGAAVFLFATEDGTISAWSPAVNATNAILEVDNSTTPSADSHAVYKGLALGSNNNGNFLFATNFRAGTVDVFDKNFAKVTLPGAFTDPNIPAGFAPFGIRNIGGNLFVTYAKQDADQHDDVAGPGNGYVDVFDTSGNLLHRFATQGTLDSPWGMTVASAKFGSFSKAILIGNFGDGHINAFDPTSGAFLGQLTDVGNGPLTIHGLWGLAFGNGAKGSDPNALYFSAGINGEQDGLFGSLRAETANERFVAQAYLDLLQRPADSAGLANWVGLLSQGASRTAIVAGIESSAEYRMVVVQQIYNALLHRGADPSGLTTFTNFLANGGTVEQIQAILAGSAEYLQTRGGGTNDGFLDALFQDAFNRTVDPSGRSGFDQALANGVSRAQVAASIFSSAEFQQDLVQNYYQRFLHRPADSGGLSGFLTALQQGTRDEQVIAAMVGSDEYFARLQS